jgi:hypothetical protein
VPDGHGVMRRGGWRNAKQLSGQTWRLQLPRSPVLVCIGHLEVVSAGLEGMEARKLCEIRSSHAVSTCFTRLNLPTLCLYNYLPPVHFLRLHSPLEHQSHTPRSPPRPSPTANSTRVRLWAIFSPYTRGSTMPHLRHYHPKLCKTFCVAVFRTQASLEHPGTALHRPGKCSVSRMMVSSSNWYLFRFSFDSQRDLLTICLPECVDDPPHATITPPTNWAGTPGIGPQPTSPNLTPAISRRRRRSSKVSVGDINDRALLGNGCVGYTSSHSTENLQAQSSFDFIGYQ